MAKKKESLVVEIAGKVNPSLGNAVSKAEKLIKNTQKIAGGAAGIAGSVVGIGAKAVAATATALGGAAAAAIKAGAEYENAFMDVQRLVKAPEGQDPGAFYENLSDKIRGMAKEMPQSAAQIAEVMASSSQLGVQSQYLDQFTRSMIMMGDSTNVSAGEAAESLARFANITGMDQANFERLASSVTVLGNTFATSQADVLNMSMGLAAAGSQVGMTEAQIMGFSAALSSVGIEAAAGGTAMSKVMVNMSLAVQKGGKDLQQYASVAGMSAEQFKTAFQTDAAGAISSFIGGLASAEEKGTTAIKMLDDMGITETRLRDTLLRASNASDLFASAIQTSNEAFEAGTGLQDVANQKYGTLQNRLGILKNKITDIGISFYQTSTGPINDAVVFASTQIDTMADAFNSGGLAGLAQSVGTVGANTVTALAEAAPQAITAAGSVISAFASGIMANFPTIAAAAVQTIYTFAMSLASALPTIAQMGISMLLTLGANLVNSGALYNIANAAVTAVGQFISTIIQNLPQIVEMGLQMAGQLINGILDGLVNAIGSIGSAIAGLFSGDSEAVTAAAEAGQQQAAAYTDAAVQAMQEQPQLTTGPIMATVDTSAAQEQGAGYVIAMADGMTGSMGDLEAAMSSVTAAASAATESAVDPTVISSNAEAATSTVQQAVQAMQNQWNQAVTNAQQAAQKIKAAFEQMTITVPQPKLPQINTTFATVGEGGASVKVPRFSVQYFAEGGIMNGPTLFGMNGGQGMVGGEAAPEAIVPLKELWRQLGDFARDITGGGGSGMPSISYAPVFQFSGGGTASRADLDGASRMGLREFERLYREMMGEARRRSL